ncbi:MAG TPA: DUF3108 domain-containing protein [Steroidobacteraceae bacterium]|jgi:hypothetical protein
MRIPDGWRLLALLVLAACCAPTASQADPLSPFQASYTWIWHGAAVAVSTLKLERRQEDTWDYSSSSEPRGLGFLYPMRPRLESLMRVGADGVQPLHFQATDGTRADERGADVSFDWNAARATGKYDGVDVDLPLKQGVQDDLSIQVALLYALRHGQPPANLSMIDRNSIRDYSYRREGTATIDTKLGRIDTIVYASQHAGSPRVTRFWCAPSKGYVPMRVQQKRIDEVEWTMEIESLQAD